MDIIIIIIGSGGVVDTIVGTNNIVIPGGGGSGISRSGRSFVANHNIIIGMTILSCVGIIMLVESSCLVSTAVAVAVGMSSTSTAAAVSSNSILPINHVVVIIDVVDVVTKICGIFSTGLFLMQRSCSCHGFVK